MKIKEVEKRTGITSHNIRFYEKEGLLNPSRNLSNGYREYTEADIQQNLILCQEFVDKGIDDLPDDMIEQIICDKEAYINSLEEIKKQDKIQRIFFVSKQLFCIIGFTLVLILSVQFYITICLTYMNRALQIFILLLAVFLLGCIAKMIYMNETG